VDIISHGKTSFELAKAKNKKRATVNAIQTMISLLRLYHTKKESSLKRYETISAHPMDFRTHDFK
jgi:hypothetical protein